VRFREIAGFAVLVSRSRHVAIDGVRVADSGSRNPAGRNNATGGILLEEGTSDFRVTRCELRNIRGNGIWTHSLYTSARNARGVFAENRLDTIGRDALQVGHATQVRVEGNTGTRIGFPEETVDVEGRAIPVGVDTAGNVDRSIYARNQFSGINGKCIDLDGFHDGEVSRNVCLDVAGYGIVMNNTNPDMQSRNVRIEDNLLDGVKYGGIFVIGENNTIRRNRLFNLNTAHCGCFYTAAEPDMFSSGIYLGKGAERPAPARGNRIEQNEITGYQMDRRPIGAAPGIDPAWNTVRDNRSW
jgi:parallel beta-helix repeat protein